MKKLENKLKDNFFIIDSNYLNDIQSKLYGFSVLNDEIIYDETLNEQKLDGTGVYIQIIKNNDYIKIFQDFNGSFGIYLYMYEDTFVISNSFYNLMEYVKIHYKITLNKDLLNSFIPADLCSLSYNETMINEITIIPREYIINIIISSKDFYFSKIDYEEHSINLDSLEGIQLLDSWFYKWIDIIRKLFNNHNLEFDLTGGFDSRVTFMLLLNSYINFNNVNINSNEMLTFKKDYEIAHSIAEKYNIKLNQSYEFDKIYFDDEKESIEYQNYVKLGFHKHPVFPKYVCSEKMYVVTGFGGETLREYWNISPKDYMINCENRARNFSNIFVNCTHNILEKNFSLLQKKYNIKDEDSPILTQFLYEDVRNRNHFGKISVSDFLVNRILLNPLMDPMLHKIKKNPGKGDLLYSVLFIRYCPELLNFKFDNGKYLSSELINEAIEINKKYPFKIRKFNYLKGMEKNSLKTTTSDIGFKEINPDNKIEEIFKSTFFKNYFLNYFSEEIYNKALYEIENKHFQNISIAYTLLCIFTVIQSIQFNQDLFNKKETNWIKSFLTKPKTDDLKSDILTELIKYNVLRIDIKNYGSESNTVEIIKSSDFFNKIMTPSWFSDEEGRGYVIESHANEIFITFKCINNGELKIFLRSKHITDINRTNFPVYIDITNFSINGKELLESHNLVTVMKPYTYSQEVKNDEIITLKIKWLPFNQECLFENK